MAAITICSDFGAPKNKVWHCFYCFPIYFPWACPSSTPGVHPNSCPLSQWCHPIISCSVVPFSSAFNLSQHQGLFKWVSCLHQVAKVLDFSFSISPSNEHPGLISFRMDWLDLLAVQGTLKSLFQHHSSKASNSSVISCLYSPTLTFIMTTGKTIALTRRTLVGKVMSLLLNMLSRLVITFLPRSKCLLISWMQSASAVILEPQK